jgi:chitosanase
MPKTRRDILELVGRASLMSALAVGARSPARAGPPGPDVKSPDVTGPESAGPQEALLRRIKAISNVFEVGSAEPDYAYVEDLGDGRGYTVTQYGFCTYNNEVAEVIGRYAEDAPATPLARFLPHLPPATMTAQPMALAGFPAAWREAAASPLLGRACDEEADRLYLRPALAAAEAAGVRSAIGKAIFYDTWLQHGAATDPDSLPSILKRAIAETGGVSEGTEADFLKAFLAIRKSVLHEPHNRATRDVWRASVRRVDALLRLVDSNPGLTPPIEVSNADIHVVVL